MKRTLLLILSLFLSFYSCQQKDALILVRFSGEAQGTYYAVTYYDSEGSNYQVDIDSILSVFDLSVSTYKPQSIISLINRNDPGVVPDEIFTDIFVRAMSISEQTEGAFDVTIAPLVNAWGFGFTDRMKVEKRMVDSLLNFVGWEKIHLKNGKLVKVYPEVQLDFNAIAQGYSVDLLGEFFESKGIDHYLIDIGGEVLARGHKPDGKKWTIGIEKPAENWDDPRELKARVELEDQALATSGSYRKYFEEDGVRYSHTIDPTTGYPVDHSLLSVSVKTFDCCTADAYATAFLIMGLEKTKEFLKSHPDLDVYLIYSDSQGNLLSYMTQGIAEILVSEE